MSDSEAVFHNTEKPLKLSYNYKVNKLAKILELFIDESKDEEAIYTHEFYPVTQYAIQKVYNKFQNKNITVHIEPPLTKSFKVHLRYAFSGAIYAQTRGIYIEKVLRNKCKSLLLKKHNILIEDENPGKNTGKGDMEVNGKFYEIKTCGFQKNGESYKLNNVWKENSLVSFYIIITSNKYNTTHKMLFIPAKIVEDKVSGNKSDIWFKMNEWDDYDLHSLKNLIDKIAVQ